MSLEEYDVGKLDEGDPFGLSGHGDYDEEDDINDETFGDIGSLNDDWEQQHSSFALSIENEHPLRKNQPGGPPPSGKPLEPFFGSEPPSREHATHLESPLEEDTHEQRIEKEMYNMMLNEEDDAPHPKFVQHSSTPPSSRSAGRFSYSSPGSTASIWGSPSSSGGHQHYQNAAPTPNNTPMKADGNPPVPNRALTLEELEARLTGKVPSPAPSHQQQAPLHHLPPHQQPGQQPQHHQQSQQQQQQQPSYPNELPPLKEHIRVHLMVNIMELQKHQLPPQQQHAIFSQMVAAASYASANNLPSVPNLPVPPPFPVSPSGAGPAQPPFQQAHQQAPSPSQPHQPQPNQQQSQRHQGPQVSPHGAQRSQQTGGMQGNYRNQQQQQQQHGPRSITLGDMMPGQQRTRDPSRGTGARRFEARRFMTAEEIESIIKMQYMQLSSSNPYTDDYYYYQLLTRKHKAGQPVTLLEGTDISLVYMHKPLCDSAPQRTFPPKKMLNDPLVGVLGRIPSHNVRAPRPLLQLIHSTTSSLEAGAGADTDAPKPAPALQQSLLLAIEGSYNILLDLEDMDGILGNSGGSDSHSFNYQHLVTKREALCEQLFRHLHIDSFPILSSNPPQPPALPPASSSSLRVPSVAPEDDYFVGICLVPKGRRLLLRSLMVFANTAHPSSKFLAPVVLSFMRNLLLLVLVPVPEAEQETYNKLYMQLGRIILAGPVQIVLLAFHTLLLFHSEQGFLLRVLQAPSGRIVVHSLLRRGGDVLRASQNEDGTSPWTDLFSAFFARLQGQMRSLFGPLGGLHMSASQQQQIWEFLVVVAQNANEMQRREMGYELREHIENSTNAAPAGPEDHNPLETLSHLVGLAR